MFNHPVRIRVSRPNGSVVWESLFRLTGSVEPPPLVADDSGRLLVPDAACPPILPPCHIQFGPA